MTAITECAPGARQSTAGYLPVQVPMLRRLPHAPVDLFVQYEAQRPPVLYHRAGCPLELDRLTSLINGGVRNIYVQSGDFQKFGSQLLAAVEASTDQGSIPPAERFAVLQLAVAAEIEHATRLMDCGPYVAVAEKVSRELTSLLTASDVLPLDLYRLARHDFSTFTHVTNVASYGIVFADHIKLCSPGELERFAKAAILHDIGKRFIPTSILSKPARLEPHERKIIETHPQRGYEELCGRDDMSVDQLMVIYQHHERYDGKGYPVGLLGDEIHPWARMLAVVDVFDAMTAERPYRRPATVSQAMEYITTSAGTHFDREMVNGWTAMMGKSRLSATASGHEIGSVAPS
jgi:HD-GYP domain-containing protein (c-di-GMP phosphodiesterase class II)